MSKEITKAFILQEMEDKFGLRELTPEKFTFSELVVPVYNVEQHLERWVNEYSEVSITSAAPFVFFTVPDTERWYLRRYDMTFMAAGAYKVSGLFTRRRGTTDSVYLDLKSAQASSYHVDLLNPVILQPGDTLRVLVDDYTSTANLRLYIDVMKEEIR